ncbi:MAG TPA: hypothetical protein VFN69_02490, partial [Rudaea sp.]|nr:hypothetical protein [Rudaea sp.]
MALQLASIATLACSSSHGMDRFERASSVTIFSREKKVTRRAEGRTEARLPQVARRFEGRTEALLLLKSMPRPAAPVLSDHKSRKPSCPDPPSMSRFAPRAP